MSCKVVGLSAIKFTNAFTKAIHFTGNEFSLLKEIPVEDIDLYQLKPVKAMSQLRVGKVQRGTDYDGVYGAICLFKESEIKAGRSNQEKLF